MRRRVRNVPPIRWSARGCPGEGARQAAQGQLVCAGRSTAPPSPRSRDVTARPCGASLRPAPARLGHRRPARTDRPRATAASRPPAARPSLEPRAPMPPLPPPGPYLAVLTLGLGTQSGLALPPRRLPGLAGSPRSTRPAAALAAD